MHEVSLIDCPAGVFSLFLSARVAEREREARRHFRLRTAELPGKISWEKKKSCQRPQERTRAQVPGLDAPWASHFREREREREKKESEKCTHQCPSPKLGGHCFHAAAHVTMPMTCGTYFALSRECWCSFVRACGRAGGWVGGCVGGWVCVCVCGKETKSRHAEGR